MIVIPCRYSNIAVWNAILQHANLIHNTGENVIFLVSKKELCHYTLLNNYSFITYNSYFSWLTRIIKIKDRNFFIISIIDYYRFLPILFLRKNQFFLWVQGELPEESYLRHKSILRKKILNFLEAFVLKRVQKIVFVSNSMLTHYQNKIGKRFQNSIVIPCISEFFYENSLSRKKKIVYLGGISIWQKIDWILIHFEKIYNIDPEYHLDIITPNINEGKQLVESNIQNVKIKEHISVFSIKDRSKLPQILAEYRFGYLLRDYNLVNYISSPIKFAEYLSCGVNVIITDAIPHYAELISKYKCGLVLKTVNFDETSLVYDQEASYRLYKDYFSKYKLVSNYSKLISS